MSYVLHELHSLPALLVYGLVVLLVFGEAALFVGFVLPGETTVLVAGVVASQGNINIDVLCILVVLAAVVGDSVGYAVGHHFGDRLLSIRLLQRHREELDAALAGMQKRGPVYVFLGRFTAFLRAVMPGLAGISRMHYRRFLVANALGGLVWGIAFSLLGYFGGSQLSKIEKYSGWASLALGALLVLSVLGVYYLRRISRRRRSQHESPLP
ncbi:MAG: DedA family protein [Acidobacteria bacterium]|nr:DedA family protein [Acidobacteriota bacterium]